MMTFTRRAITRAAASAAFLVSAALATNQASAAQTFPDPGGSGASVTLSTTEVYPGQRVAISGTGFLGSQPAGPGGTEPAGGVPLIAIKPYDIDTNWTWGGTSAYNGPDDAKIWFAPDAVAGNFSGYIDIPSSLTPDGILGDPFKGQNWLRILSGAFSTGGSGPFTGNTTVPITYKVPFTVVDRLVLGLTGPGASPLFQPGSVFRPGASITVRSQDFTPNTAVTVSLDGVTLASSITTTAEGTFPSTARVVIPQGTAPGAHTLTFTTGGISASRTITVTAPPTATLLTPSARAANRIAFKLTGYVGVGGTGQKVAVVVNEAVLACLTATAAGDLFGSAVLPATLADGPVIVGFNAGTSCAGPGSPVNDQPGTRVTQTLNVAVTAPTLSVSSSVTTGQQVAITGAGFAADLSLAASIDGTTLAGQTVTTAADGTFSAQLTIPSDIAEGERLLVLNGGGQGAAATLLAKAPAPAPGENGEQPKADAPRTDSPKNQPPSKPASAGIAKAKLKGTKITVSLTAPAAKGTKIVIRSQKKIKLSSRGKVKNVTIARQSLRKTGRTLALTPTADGKRAFKRYKTLRVTIEVAAPGASPTTKTVTLKP